MAARWHKRGIVAISCFALLCEWLLRAHGKKVCHQGFALHGSFARMPCGRCIGHTRRSAKGAIGRSASHMLEHTPAAEPDIEGLLELLPPRITVAHPEDLLEVVLDQGRSPVGRFGGFDGKESEEVVLDQAPITADELASICNHPSLTAWTSDNRASVSGSLHRVARITNLEDMVIGLTLRVGRHRYGQVEKIDDIVRGRRSTLLLGAPGTGKTTVLREYARVLSEVYHHRVVIVDTSNEIGGGGNTPHPAIGERTRRLMVRRRSEQHQVMLEAVQNHNPEVLIIDEIGSKEEALAAASIAQRGVTLVATAHGQTLEQLVRNPVLNTIVGGIETVTLGDAMIKSQQFDRRKLIQQRIASPVFDVVIELDPRVGQAGTWRVYPEVNDAVDRLLLGEQPVSQLRAQEDSNEATGNDEDAVAAVVEQPVREPDQVAELSNEQTLESIEWHDDGEDSDFADVGDAHREFFVDVNRLLKIASRIAVRRPKKAYGRKPAKFMTETEVDLMLHKVQTKKVELDQRFPGDAKTTGIRRTARRLQRAEENIESMKRWVAKGDHQFFMRMKGKSRVTQASG